MNRLESIKRFLSVGKEYDGVVEKITSTGIYVNIGSFSGIIKNSEYVNDKICYGDQLTSVGSDIKVVTKRIDGQKILFRINR